MLFDEGGHHMTDETESSTLTAQDSTGGNDTAQDDSTQSTAENVETKETTDSSPEAQAKELEQFMDPKDLPDDLKPHFKRMQASFTKKMQSAKELNDKAKLVDAYNADPIGFTRQLAAQHGLNLNSQAPQGNTGEQTEFKPDNWNEVFKEFEGRMSAYLANHFQPVLQEVKDVKQKQIESILDKEAPEWREYEDDMISMLQAHPTLAKDTEKLIKLAIPKEVIEGRAMQKALSRINKKGEAAKVSRGSTTTKQVAPSKSGVMSFADAIKAAKSDLA